MEDSSNHGREGSSKLLELKYQLLKNVQLRREFVVADQVLEVDRHISVEGG